MPTIPPEPNEPTNVEPHRAREVAESFGVDPERYDRARPTYPEALVDAVVAASPGRELVDVGIGTGIAALQFQAAGCHVVGVEVDARMAELARRRGFKVDVAAFEAWDAAGRSFDAVVSGQAWHWIDPVAGAAKAAAVLRPGGLLAVFWNVAEAHPEMREAFAAVYRRVLPDLPFNPWARSAVDGYSVITEKASKEIAATGAFSHPEQWHFDWERSYSGDEWLDQLPTHGGHANLAPAKLEEVLAGIGAAIDAVGGSFTMGYQTLAITAKRTGTGAKAPR